MIVARKPARGTDKSMIDKNIQPTCKTGKRLKHYWDTEMHKY